ncbi:MAG: tRNA lysidine(34) synthetase TilS [Acidimicrobiia bacterium]|nr:tRNA lysidine(34) synthetase TilS [Acidimicrobiia bacterium]
MTGSGPVDVPLVDRLAPRCTFPPPGTAVTCAVSGGADSLALLVLAAAAGCAVTAVHVDHGLRAGSAAEAEVVRLAAHRFGAAVRCESVELSPGPNLEARARAARYAVLPPDVLTGHTADDQAETVLLNLMRGAGIDGLAGMRPARHPILALRRSETVALCAELGLDPVDDPSNHDPVHRRNRVRHELVPLLDEIAGRDVTPILVRQAALLADAAAHLDAAASELDPAEGRVLREAPVVLSRIALRRWITEATGSEHPVDSAAVERALDVARGSIPSADLLGGWCVRRTAGRLRIERR